MSQMNEMQMTIQSLRECAAVIVDTADYLAQAFSGEVEAKQELKSEKSLKLEVVRAVLADKSRSGKTTEVKALITSFGVDKLSDIDPNNYAELMKKAEVL